MFIDTFTQLYDVTTGYEATAISRDGDEVPVHAQNDDGEVKEVTGDELLVTTGRRPNSDTLQVEDAGIETDEKGFVEVNEMFETMAENVWAMGDIVGNHMF